MAAGWLRVLKASRVSDSGSTGSAFNRKRSGHSWWRLDPAVLHRRGCGRRSSRHRRHGGERPAVEPRERHPGLRRLCRSVQHHHDQRLGQPADRSSRGGRYRYLPERDLGPQRVPVGSAEPHDQSHRPDQRRLRPRSGAGPPTGPHLFGGFDGTDCLADTWTWDGTNSTEGETRPPAPRPGPAPPSSTSTVGSCCTAGTTAPAISMTPN